MVRVEPTVDLRRKPKFFKVIVPDFSCKLDIPIAFHKHLVPQKIAAIRSPIGTWHIKIQGTVPNLYFGEGWPRFALKHGLDVGYFLVFCLEGGLNFSVIVLDRSLCEKEFLLPPVNGNLFHKENCRGREEERHLGCMGIETPCKKKRKKGAGKVANVVMGTIKEEEVHDEVSTETNQHKRMGSKVKKRVIERKKDVDKEKKRNKAKISESSRGVKLILNSRIEDFEGSAGLGSGKLNSKKGLCNREDRILGRQFTGKKSRDHLEDWEKVQKSRRVEEIDDSLHVSLKETTTRREVKSRVDKCCNSKSITRNYKEHILVYARRKSKRIKDCTTLENDFLLEDPEVLVRTKMKANKSERVRKRKNAFNKRDEEKRKTKTKGSVDVLGADNVNKVKNIIPKGNCKRNKSRESKIEVSYGLRNRKVYKESLYSDVATGDDSTEKVPPKYRVTLKPRNLDGHYYIYIPVQFKEHTGISVRDKLFLKDPKGDLWPVDVLHSTKNRTLLSRGWKEFCLGNYLRPGDDCEFQLDPELKENTKVIEVSILKKFKRQRVEALKVQRTCGSNISGTPMFWHILTASQKTTALQIPNAFAASVGILETRRVMLRYMNGDPFTVKLTHSTRKRVLLSTGWNEFCNMYLKYGDVCEFRLESDSDGIPLFQVRKLEKPPIAS